jgi:hypothetical protein
MRQDRDGASISRPTACRHCDRKGNAVSSASFATLLNSKIFVPSSLQTHYYVEKFFLAQCLGGYISNIYVDEKWYLSTYRDVARAVEKDETLTARDHYTRWGYFENRMPYEIKINEGWYRSNYKDVEQAVAEKKFPNAQDHFDRVGYLEGRLPYAGFSLRSVRDE